MGYGLDDCFSNPGRSKNFLFHSVQARSGILPTSYAMGIGGDLLELKRPGL
jgi:hypothetical protein